MTFANLTPLSSLDVPVTDPTGRALVLVVVKGTFDLQGNRLERQAPVRVADVPTDPDADDSSVRWPSDLALAKTGADVVVVGSARSRRPVKAQEVVVRVADRRLHLRAHGERLFYRGAGGRVVVGEAVPFEDKPIVYKKKLIFFDGNDVANDFEGVLRYVAPGSQRAILLAIGVDILDAYGPDVKPGPMDDRNASLFFQASPNDEWQGKYSLAVKKPGGYQKPPFEVMKNKDQVRFKFHYDTDTIGAEDKKGS